MKNKEQKIVRLLEEGFSYDTIKKMNDYHLKKIYKKLVNEEETSTVQKTTYSKSDVQRIKNNDGGINVNGIVTPNDDGSVTVTQQMEEEMTEDNDLDKSVEKESGFNPYAGNSPGNTEGPAGNNPSPNSDGMGYIDEEAVIEALFGNSNKKMKTPITTLGMFEETNEGTKCWKGYEKKGMKTMFGKRVPNCVKKKSREEKVSQIEESILSLIKKSQGKMLTKKDILSEQPSIAPARPTVKPGIKPERGTPYKPKHSPKPKAGEEGGLPEFLKFNNLNIQFKDE